LVPIPGEKDIDSKQRVMMEKEKRRKEEEEKHIKQLD